MSQRNDPFQNSDPRFEPWQGPQDESEFSQPDLTPRTLKEWLRSDECAVELEKQPNRPVQKIVRFVDTPRGPELHVEQGDVARVFVGPRSELEKIARAHGAAI